MTIGSPGAGRGNGRAKLVLRLASLAAVGLVFAMVNIASEQTDIAGRGLKIDPREPIVWELTSWAALLAASVFLIAGERSLIVRRPVGVRALLVLACAAGFSTAHIAVMTALRIAAYAAAGATYHPGPAADVLLYEGRKDTLTFAAVVTLFWLWRRAFETPRPTVQPAAPPADPAFIAETRQGRVVLHAPEIDWVEAQGNYVALHARGQSYLIRQPLKAMDAKLKAAAFVRSHRSALVNTRRVRAIHRADDGFKVELSNDELAPLSGRHRAAVVRALAAG